MYGFFPKEYGAAAIRFLCRPLELLFSDEIVGRILQGIHVFGYIALLLLTIYIPSMQWITITILGALLFLFWIFGGCILTKAEIHYLKRIETVPGNVLRWMGFRVKDKQTAIKLQSLLSIAFMSIPIIVILLNKIISHNKSEDAGVAGSIIQ
jgi:hypothetical protein